MPDQNKQVEQWYITVEVYDEITAHDTAKVLEGMGYIVAGIGKAPAVTSDNV